MKPTFREIVIKVHALHSRGVGYPEIAKKLKIAHSEEVVGLVRAGEKILAVESCNLTQAEWDLMRALVRAEIRAIETATWLPKTAAVDRAAGKYSGWCFATANKRLRMARDGEAGPHKHRIGLVYLSDRKPASIHLTAAGWAFAWEAGLILENWKVPA